MKCIKCGVEIPDHADFCTNCETQQEFNQTLIERAKNGDAQAETKLYNATYNNVYALIKSMVKDEDTALDLLQDSYVKAFRNLGQLQEANKFRPWLKTIARNRTMDYFRERKTVLFSEMTPLDDEDTEVEFEDTNPETMPDVVIDRQETARLLGEILDTLPDGQRSVLSMHYYEQMSVKEIAAALDMNQNTVLTNLHSGRKKVEKKVLDLEKRGTRIYGLAPIPFLLLLLRKSEAHAMEPASAASSLTQILQQTGNAADTAAQEASVQAAKSAAGEAAQTSASSVAEAAGQAATGTAQGVAGVAAATAAKAGIPLTAKIIAAVAAVAVVGIGAAVVIPAVRGNDTPQTEITAEAPVAVTETEDAVLLSVEEELTQFAMHAEQGALDEVQLLLNSEAFTRVYEELGDVEEELPLFADTAYGRVGIYRNEQMDTPSQIMLYWGGFENEIRQGEGIWCSPEYIATGTWSGDKPNGEQVAYISGLTVHIGSVRDGLWDGPVRVARPLVFSAESANNPGLAEFSPGQKEARWTGDPPKIPDEETWVFWEGTYQEGKMDIVYIDTDTSDGSYAYYYAMTNTKGEDHRFSYGDAGLAFLGRHGIRGFAEYWGMVYRDVRSGWQHADGTVAEGHEAVPAIEMMDWTVGDIIDRYGDDYQLEISPRDERGDSFVMTYSGEPDLIIQPFVQGEVFDLKTFRSSRVLYMSVNSKEEIAQGITGACTWPELQEMCRETGIDVEKPQFEAYLGAAVTRFRYQDVDFACIWRGDPDTTPCDQVSLYKGF